MNEKGNLKEKGIGKENLKLIGSFKEGGIKRIGTFKEKKKKKDKGKGGSINI